MPDIFNMATEEVCSCNSNNSLKRCRSCYFEERVVPDKRHKLNIHRNLIPDEMLKKLIHSKKIIALDCEMVGTGKNFRSALARCSIVNYHGAVIYDKFVKPETEITDYRTQWSGVRPEHMEDAIPFKTARTQVRRLLKNKILVGHAVYFDMEVLNLKHPLCLTRDTSYFVPLREMAGLDMYMSPSLKKLSLSLLYKNIQCGEHCSVEDAKATMELYKMVESNWEKTDSDSKYLEDKYWPS